MVEPNEIFDFWGILSNDVVGDPWITIFIFTIAIIFVSIKVKMPFELQILFIILSLSMFFSKLQSFEIIWVFVVMMVGMMFYWAMGKLLTS